MANAIYIGLIHCPLCGSDQATVHEQRTGNKKGARYFRCYTEINGTAQRCGTIQCLGPTGQDYINANMRPIGSTAPAPEPIGSPAPAPEPAPEPIGAPEPAPEPIADPPPKPRESLLPSWLVGGDDDD